jgi:hypothetical protein
MFVLVEVGITKSGMCTFRHHQYYLVLWQCTTNEYERDHSPKEERFYKDQVCMH